MRAGSPDNAFSSQLSEGTKVICAMAKLLPEAPGVYRMIGKNKEILYVGKAVNLKKRVASYARTRKLSQRLLTMISMTQDMSFVRTRTEEEAFLLETNYIKQLKPRFNVLMKDGKSLPYILLKKHAKADQILKHRGARTLPGAYFGPFASSATIHHTLDTLQKAFLLRTCADSFFKNRSRPCLLYQIQRCAAPCVDKISATEYQALIRQAKDFLSGKKRAVYKELEEKMTELSENLDFEKAACIRDRLKTLANLHASQSVNLHQTKEADVFAVAEAGGKFVVEVFFFRAFQNWGNYTFYPRADPSLSLEEVLDGAVRLFYADKPAPSLILLNCKIPNQRLLEKTLVEKNEHAVKIEVAETGEKKNLIEHALKNAQDALARHLVETADQKSLFAQLTKRLEHDKIIRRVDVFDNSHLMGTHAVGAVIVAGEEGFMKTHYRRFNFLPEITKGDDLSMMRDVMKRYLVHLKQEGEGRDLEHFPEKPDLLLIDGGALQLQSVLEVLREANVNIPVMAVSKGPDRQAGRESLHLPEKKPFKPSPQDPMLYFIQRLRDEAHRFAISLHRSKRKKAMRENSLDMIQGIGAKKKKALLLHFGTTSKITEVSLEELTETPGINATLAKKIYDYFHDLEVRSD